MAKGDFYIHQHQHHKVRQLCRDINKRADDRETLQILVVRLQEALREEHYTTHSFAHTARPQTEDPFDKILVA